MSRKRHVKKQFRLRITDFISKDEMWKLMRTLLPGEGLKVDDDKTGVVRFIWNQDLLKKAYLKKGK